MFERHVQKIVKCVVVRDRAQLVRNESQSVERHQNIVLVTSTHCFAGNQLVRKHTLELDANLPPPRLRKLALDHFEWSAWTRHLQSTHFRYRSPPETVQVST